MAIAEALASFTPVITTKGAPWKDLETYSCGWWIDIGMEPLKIKLEEAISKDHLELKEMGINGRNLLKINITLKL